MSPPDPSCNRSGSTKNSAVETFNGSNTSRFALSAWDAVGKGVTSGTSEYRPGDKCFTTADILRSHFVTASRASNVSVHCSDRSFERGALPHFIVYIQSQLRQHVARGIHVFEVPGCDHQFAHSFHVLLNHQIAYSREVIMSGREGEKKETEIEKIHEGNLGIQILGHPIFHPNASLSDEKVIYAARPVRLLSIANAQRYPALQSDINRFVSRVTRTFAVKSEVVRAAEAMLCSAYNERARMLPGQPHVHTINYDEYVRSTPFDKRKAGPAAVRQITAASEAKPPAPL